MAGFSSEKEEENRIMSFTKKNKFQNSRFPSVRSYLFCFAIFPQKSSVNTQKKSNGNFVKVSSLDKKKSKKSMSR